MDERACNDVVVGGVSRSTRHCPTVLLGHRRLSCGHIVLASICLAIHVAKIDLGCNRGVLFEIVHCKEWTIL